MKEKATSILSLLINALLFITLGCILFFLPKNSLTILSLLLTSAITIISTFSLITCIFKKDTKGLPNAILTLILGITTYWLPALFLSSFSLIIGLYILINAIIKFITYSIYYRQKIKGRLIILIGCIIDLIFSLILFTHPYSTLETTTIIFGIYLILLGIPYLYSIIEEIFPHHTEKTKRKIRITMPAIIVALIPYYMVKNINNMVNKNETSITIDNKNENKTIDLEILIHVKKSGNGIFGHADIYFEGKVYSYGNYDRDSFHLFESIGDGILVEFESKKDYIKFCTTHSKKTLFVYGISLTEKQKQIVKQQLNKVKENTYRWYAKAEQIPHKKEEFNDYPSILYDNLEVKFYKFTKGSFKTYFLFFTNCVKLVDYIIGPTGIDLLKLNGIITPGTYYQYLNHEFKRKNSNVQTKKIYTEIKKNQSTKKK